MLFVSFDFIFYFMPLFLLGYFALGRLGFGGCNFLIAASLFFYGWWDYWQVAVLIVSTAVNYYVYLQIRAQHSVDGGWRALLAGLVFNLGVLGYFKYAGFLVSIWSSLMGTPHEFTSGYLPLGISFFTFTQIMFLVDIYKQPRHEVTYRDFLAFVSFFPHLIAGPLLHHRRIIPQLRRDQTYLWSTSAFATGLTLLVIGLFKKLVIADSLASHPDLVFAAAEKGTQVSFVAAWIAALSYTFQLYFDFSAYCDMALGLAKMINIRMPINFYSPYKSTSIREFWRRWHITLSFFLRNYLYIPLGGGRGGRTRRDINLMVTLVLGGIWHGAGWTFVIWGALHGAYLVVNHTWRDLGLRLPAPLGWAVTFLAVVIGWAVFRAETVPGALNVLSGMFGGHGLPQLPALTGLVDPITVPSAAAPSFLPGARDLAWLACAAFVAIALPNSIQLTWTGRPGLNIIGAKRRTNGRRTVVLWRPSLPWGLAMSALAICAFVVALNRQVEVKFLYFQF